MSQKKKAAVYVRLSLSREESVSIERQTEACRQYAEARGWEVVLVAEDDSVSATKRRPQDRKGWRKILEYQGRLDAVVAWKIDRVARRALDFLEAHAALQERGAGIVAVEDPIDMTTAQGRAFATMLAVFAQMEADAIAARTKGARAFLVAKGRAIGNRPWPYESVANPDGPGLVWRPIPERAALVRDAAADIAAGRAGLREVARRWTEAGVPTPTRKAQSWNPASVRVLLTNPVLTGALVNAGQWQRNPDGTIARDPERAILTPAEHAAVVEAISARRIREGARPIRLPLLHGLAVCSGCGKPMTARRPSNPKQPHLYVCQNRDCKRRVTVMMEHLESYVVAQFKEQANDINFQATARRRGGPDPAAIEALQQAIADVREALEFTDDADQAAALVRRRGELRADLARLQDEQSAPAGEWTLSLLDLWDDAAGDEGHARRTRLLGAVFARVVVGPGRAVRGFDAGRVTLERTETRTAQR